MNDSITCTNGDLWLASQPAEPNTRAPLAALLKCPMTVLAVRNGSALARAVESAVKDIDVARLALCEQYGTKAEDGSSYTITDQAGFTAGWATLMAEPITLTGVRAIKISELAQGSFVAPDDVSRCGPLVIVD